MGEPKKGRKPRSHARSAGNTQTSISMRTEIIDLGKKLAAKDMRTFSNFLSSLIAEEAKRRGLAADPPGTTKKPTPIVHFTTETDLERVAEDT